MSLGTISSIAGGDADAQGPLFVNNVSFLADDAYPTGGTAAFNAFIRALFDDQRAVLCVVGDDGVNDYRYDVAADKLVAFVMATGVQVANTTDISANTAKLTVFSK